MKKYNIKTFKKLKSNVVGVGVPDDPLKKKKHTNKPLSNEISKCYYTFLKIEKDNKTGRRGRRPLQVIKSNFGITLIALIITIIVLLILAGVTLNMVMGENGLFGKANNAKNKTEVAQYEEELRMCVLELQTEEASNGRTFNMDTIRDNLDTYTQKLEDETIEWKEKDIEEPTGIYKGYNFYIDKKYGAHIKDKATGTQISMKILSEIPETGYTNQDVSLKIIITNNEKGINKIIKPDGNTENLNGAKTYEEEKTATENTKYTYVVTDTEGKEETKEVEIKIIDKNAPQDFSIEAQVTEEGIQITATPEDAEETETNASSGINKVEYYVKKDTETEFTNKGTENIIKELPSGTYSVYAKAYDKAGNEKESTNTVTGLKVSAVYKNITAQMVAEHPELYYGLTVTNYESQNGQKDWKIFYSDWNENPNDAHIFLITGDYADLSQPDRLDANTGMALYSGAKYRVNWTSVPNFQEVDENVLERLKGTGYNIKQYSKEDNSKCASTLLNANNWAKYKDNSGKAEYAVGGSTLEMWISSWNNLYEKKYGKIYFGLNEDGYYIGNTEEPQAYNLNVQVSDNDKLYFSQDTSVVDGGKNTKFYWLSSPNPSTGAPSLYVIGYGNINYDSYKYFNDRMCVALRPVVSLNKDVTVDAKDSE